MRKSRYFLALGFVTFTLATGCTEKNSGGLKEEDTQQLETKCEAKECIQLLNPKNTVEEINEIIGFSGEKSEYTHKYTWKLSAKESIILITSTGSAILQATIDKSTIKNENNDFSAYGEIKKALDKGKSFTYKEMVKKLGGVEGTLAGKTTTTNRYIWVDKHDRMFSATFSNKKNGKCTIISLQ